VLKPFHFFIPGFCPGIHGRNTPRRVGSRWASGFRTLRTGRVAPVVPDAWTVFWRRSPRARLGGIGAVPDLRELWGAGHPRTSPRNDLAHSHSGHIPHPPSPGLPHATPGQNSINKYMLFCKLDKLPLALGNRPHYCAINFAQVHTDTFLEKFLTYEMDQLHVEDQARHADSNRQGDPACTSP
jgi:hypothetical protein